MSPWLMAASPLSSQRGEGRSSRSIRWSESSVAECVRPCGKGKINSPEVNTSYHPHDSSSSPSGSRTRQSVGVQPTRTWSPTRTPPWPTTLGILAMKSRAPAYGQAQAQMVAQEGDVLDDGVELVGVEAGLGRDGDALGADGQGGVVAGTAGGDAQGVDYLIAAFHRADVSVDGGHPPPAGGCSRRRNGRRRSTPALRTGLRVRRSARCLLRAARRFGPTSPWPPAGRG